MNEFIQEETRNFKELFKRIKRKDFSGTSGQAIKNSSYQLSQNLIMKLGSLFFTIIIARMLLPELFGLYSLALATIILFVSFSDLGVSSALITFGSKMLGKGNKPKAKAYVKKLLKWKLNLVFATSIILLLSSYFISNIYYNKPIFYALLAGAIYIPLVTLLGFFESLFKVTNDFKYPLIKEGVFQVLRFIFVPLAIFLLLRTKLSNDIFIALIILTISFCYLITNLFLIFFAKRKINFLKIKEEKLNKKESIELKNFIIPLTTIAFSGVFFGYIDILMLGHFVSAEFISYYGSAFSLVGAAAAIIGFTSMALLPLFSKLKGKSLDDLFKKTRNFTILISFITSIFTYFFAKHIIQIAYGGEYLQAVPILRIFSIIIFVIPIVGLYGSYLISQEKTKTLAFLLISATIINIVLNILAINYGLRFGEFEAVLGATFATIISRIIYLIGLILFRK